MEASEVASKEEFSEVMEFEFKTFFASAGARSSDKEGERARSQKKTSSTSMSVQGENQEIASIISDVYAPTFEFKLSSRNGSRRFHNSPKPSNLPLVQ